VRVIDFRVRPPVAGFEAGRMYAAPARTSFPFVPLRAYRERFLRIVANDAVAERVLHANTARLLRLA